MADSETVTKSNLKTVAIIQARLGSTRLPGKVLKPISGKTILEHIVLRLKASREIDGIVIATTTANADDGIVKAAGDYGVRSFRGSEENVLERFYQAAKKFQADIIVRITSDCPLIDPKVLDQMLKEFKADRTIDYMSNTIKRTFPRGLDVEIFTFGALQAAYKKAKETFEKEHVTPFIYQHPEEFTLKSFTNEKDFSKFRWTVDTEEDFELVHKIYGALYEDGKIFTTEEALSFLEKMPELAMINSHIEQKELKDASKA